MTKEITKAIILQELQDKFQLRDFDPAKFLFDETVVPVYEVGDHLKTWEVLHATLPMTSATSFQFFTVPATERWVLRAYQVIYGAPGAIKGTGLYISMRPNGSDIMYLDMTKNQEISYLTNLPHPVTLEPGNQLRYLIDTYVSDQDLTVYIDVQKEEIR